MDAQSYVKVLFVLFRAKCIPHYTQKWYVLKNADVVLKGANCCCARVSSPNTRILDNLQQQSSSKLKVVIKLIYQQFQPGLLCVMRLKRGCYRRGALSQSSTSFVIFAPRRGPKWSMNQVIWAHELDRGDRSHDARSVISGGGEQNV